MDNTIPTFRVESCGSLRACHNIFYVVMQRLGDVFVQMRTRLASSADVCDEVVSALVSIGISWWWSRDDIKGCEDFAV